MPRAPMGAGALFLACIVSCSLGLLSGCAPSNWLYPNGFDSFAAPLGYDDSGAAAFISAAAVCLQSEKDDTQANLDQIDAMCAKIMGEHPDTDLIVFPELCTGWIIGLSDPKAYIASIAETIPGPSTNFVAGLAASCGVTIVFGLAEADGGKYYNSQAALKPDGSLARYRKRGLNEGDIENGFSRGEGNASIEIKGIGISLFICSDYQDEEVIREISRDPSRIVAASLFTVTILNNDIDFLAKALSKWVVYGNGGGTQGAFSFPGRVFVADPTGRTRDPRSGPGSYSWAHMGIYR